MQNRLVNRKRGVFGRFAFVIVCLSLIVSQFAPVLAATAPTRSAGINSDPESRKRAEALLAQMTLAEKIGQMNQLFFMAQFMKPDAFDASIRKGEIGSFLFVTDPVLINRLQKVAVTETRLKIPLIFGFDVIHGLSTIFPVPIANAASWDPKGVERSQAVAAREARSVGINWTFAPMVDIARDPRWGRIVEGAGEDPFLGSAIAAAQVRGFQGDRIGAPERVLACVKHFAGYGAAEGGRDYEASNIPDSQMYNVYLPPFKAAIDAGAGSLMSAYMDLNDVPATGNYWLMQSVLRDDWKFGGFVVSDADAVKNLETHGYARNPFDAAVKGANAGVNMEMSFNAMTYLKNLETAVKQGKVSEKRIDEMVLPILEMKYRLGLFENPYVDVAKVKPTMDDPSHRAAAKAAAISSAVLLRNEKSTLPLAKEKLKKVAVVGALADSKRDIVGSWVFVQDNDKITTILGGIKQKLGSGAEVSFAPGVQIKRTLPSIFDAFFPGPKSTPWTPAEADQEIAKAAKLASDSDVAIVVIGENQDMSGEAASRMSLDLPGRQLEMLKAVVATGKPVVVVLMNGRPLDISWANENVPAILEAWYPGTAGGDAVADLLFGDAVPGGKLPITWVKDEGQIPLYYSHTLSQEPSKQGKRYWEGPNAPIYPFGFGLSYTTFAYSNLKVANPAVKTGDTVEVSVDVKNTGARTGDEVVQLYIHQQSGNASRPVRELKGFERVTLNAGETKTIRFKLTPNELRYWNSGSRSWVQDAAMFDVWAGGDSTASLHSSFEVK